MRRMPYGSRWRVVVQGLMLFSAGSAGVTGGRARAGDEPISISEYRETRPTIDMIDPVRLLSAPKAEQLEVEIKSAYAKLAPAVVRIWKHDGQGQAATAVASGAIISRNGLVLTCSHHDLAPGTPIAIELADGKRVPGKILGRFRLDDPKPMLFGPDLGLATISNGDDWPAVAVDDAGQPDGGQVCLTIGYPGTLGPGRPPILRVGRVIPSAPGWPWVESTTTGMPGDSGGPLFDMQGRILGILASADTVAKYQSVVPLQAYRERLEAGEIVSAPKPGIRAMRARPAQPAAFNPALDIEDRVLQMQSSVIRIMEGPHEVAAGLIVDEDGWAITKASLVGRRERWSCRLFFSRDGTMIVQGRVVATSAEHDLALMKLEARAWQMVHWADRRPAVGTLVSTVLGRTAGPLQFAIVGAEASPEPARAS